MRDLKIEYDAICEEYLFRFCKQMGLDYETDSWVGGECGTIASIGDYFFDFHEVIKYCVDNNISDFIMFLRWWDYNLDAHYLGLNSINLRSWLMGAPRLTDEQINGLKEKRKELQDLVDKYKNDF